MPEPTQLGFVSIQVSDLDASRQFYTDVIADPDGYWLTLQETKAP